MIQPKLPGKDVVLTTVTRRRLLKLSAQPFCQGEPGSMCNASTSAASKNLRIAWLYIVHCKEANMLVVLLTARDLVAYSLWILDHEEKMRRLYALKQLRDDIDP